MATKFGLGAEIQSPTGLCLYLSVLLLLLLLLLHLVTVCWVKCPMMSLCVTAVHSRILQRLFSVSLRFSVLIHWHCARYDFLMVSSLTHYSHWLNLYEPVSALHLPTSISEILHWHNLQSASSAFRLIKFVRYRFESNLHTYIHLYSAIIQLHKTNVKTHLHVRCFGSSSCSCIADFWPLIHYLNYLLAKFLLNMALLM